MTRTRAGTTARRLFSLGLSVLLVSTVIADDILQIETSSLTTYLVGSTIKQDVSPLDFQRGVMLDGSLRAPAGFAWALSGQPQGESWNAQRYLGPIDLASGGYAPTEFDLALPGPGMSWVVGRSFNGRQEKSSSHYDSDGLQGFNWFQLSQPEILLYDADSNSGTEQAADILYLVYGADRYLEFKRIQANSAEFKGKNGAAGAFKKTSGSPDTYTYTDQTGNQTVFFGFNTSGNTTNGQFWKLTDPAGNVLYVGDSTTASTAITNGYNSGRITTAYDAAANDGRRYTYTYTTVKSVPRLDRVKAETKTGGTWASPTGVTEVARVDYAYYTADADAHGKAGDLKLVTITTPLTDSGLSLVKEKYYRYYDDAWSNSDGRRGEPHQVKMVVGFEGTRNFDWGEAGAESPEVLDDGYLTASDTDLKPFAEAYFEYGSASDYQVSKVWFNGECGCSGGANGTYTFSYARSGGTFTGNYDNQWLIRNTVKQPDSMYLSQYFDEAGQPYARAFTDGDPAVSYTDSWITGVSRSNVGVITSFGTPANQTGYTHSTGATTSSTSAGKIVSVDRVSAATPVVQFPEAGRTKKGTSDTNNYLQWYVTYDTRSLSIGTTTIDRPFVSARQTYHTETTTVGTSTTYDETLFAIDTMSGYHSSTNTDPKYLRPKKLTITNPVVTTVQNGSNSATTREQYFRADGTLAFTKSESGVWTYTQYTNGQLVKRIEDAQTNHGSDFASGDDPNTDFGIIETASGLRLVTAYAYDAQGRLDTTTLPSGRVMKMYYGKLADGRPVTISVPRMVTSGSTTYYGPVTYQVANHAGRIEFQGTVSLAAAGITTAFTSWIDETSSDPITAIDVGTLARMSTSVYTSAGTQLTQSRTYFVIPGSGAGTEGTNYDAVRYGYDDMGRQRRVKDTGGTITRTTFDELGRAWRRHIGTNDNGDAGGEASGTNNMVKVEEIEYDSGSSGGNSLVTIQTVYVQDSTTDQRQTSFEYDYRGRRIVQNNPQAPHVLHKYDNLGRVTATGLYSATSGLDETDDPTSLTTDRVGLSRTYFDARGQVYKTQRHKITQSTGADADNIATNNWYDAQGRLIKTHGEQLAKTAYDALGRPTNRFVLASMNDSIYGDADDVTGDVVLEEHQIYYESTTGNALMQASIFRHHTDYGGSKTTGALDTDTDLSLLDFTGSKIKGRLQLTAMYYDALDRLTDSVARGTFSNTDFDRDTQTLPSRSSTALITSYTYNDDGSLKETTDPEGRVTRNTYDEAGRRAVEIRNYINGTPSGTTGDDDVHTRFAYTAGHMTKMWVDFDGDGTEDAGDQVTTYTFGVTKGTGDADSKIASNNLLYKVVYPEQSGGQAEADRRTLFAYNAQGQTKYAQDATGTIIQTMYDTAGRETHRRATTVASGQDSAVLRITTAYDSRGLPTTVTQYDNATVGSGSVVDEVKHVYDDWGLVSNFTQDPDGSVGSTDDYDVAYTHAKAGSSSTRYTLRRTHQKLYYNTTELQSVVYGYSSTGSLLDDDASRVTTVTLGATLVAEYRYLGQSQLIDTDLAQPDVFSRIHGGESAGTPATYPDLDIFNRITVNRWTKDLGTDRDFHKVELSYDENSNITLAKDHIHDATAGGTRHFDVSYTIDSLDRLKQAVEGNWNGSAISTPPRTDERWLDGSGNPALDQAGNWTRHRLDLNGDGDFVDTNELDDTRSFSDANELKTRDTDSNASVNYTLAYNKRGDQTDDGKDYTYEYDAFGRLRKIKNRSNANLVAEYRYNGLGFRMGWHYDADADADVDANDPWYYFAHDERWCQVATFRGADTSPKETWVYHAAGANGSGHSSYIDAVILRDRDANTTWTSAADGTLEERRYLLQNWRGDVSVIIRDTNTSTQALILEWIKYSSYGIPFSIPFHDMDADGVFENADVTAFSTRYNTAVGAAAYDVRTDSNLDGSMTSNDQSAHTNDWLTAVIGGRGLLSRSDVANRFGYAAYQWDPAVRKYHVRYRLYDPELGHWVTRDPAGYVDGPNPYAALKLNPLAQRDSTGQFCDGGCNSMGPPFVLPPVEHWLPNPPPLPDLGRPGKGNMTKEQCDSCISLVAQDPWIQELIRLANKTCGGWDMSKVNCDCRCPRTVQPGSPPGGEPPMACQVQGEISFCPQNFTIPFENAILCSAYRSVLTHELVHVIDVCWETRYPITPGGGPLGDACLSWMCREIRAHVVDGECYSRNPSHLKECIIDRLKLSYLPRPPCSGKPISDAQWDALWLKCFDPWAPGIYPGLPPYPKPGYVPLNRDPSLRSGIAEPHL